MTASRRHGGKFGLFAFPKITKEGRLLNSGDASSVKTGLSDNGTEALKGQEPGVYGFLVEDKADGDQVRKAFRNAKRYTTPHVVFEDHIPCRTVYRVLCKPGKVRTDKKRPLPQNICDSSDTVLQGIIFVVNDAAKDGEHALYGWDSRLELQTCNPDAEKAASEGSGLHAAIHRTENSTYDSQKKNLQKDRPKSSLVIRSFMMMAG